MNIQLQSAYSFYRLGKRNNQEDFRYPNCDCPDTSQGFFMVCDGVGGADAGELASKVVSEVFVGKLINFHNGNSLSVQQLFDFTFSAYEELGKKCQIASYHQVATTLTFLAFTDRGLLAAHLGDSRIYHVRPDVGLIYRSKDHSLVQQMLDEGSLSTEQVPNFKHKNVITRCIVAGEGSEYFNPTVYCSDDIQEKDVFFLCTDGVYNEIEENTLIEILSDTNRTSIEKLNLIAELSMQSGDNNTAYLITVGLITGRPPKTKSVLFDKNNNHTFAQPSPKRTNVWSNLMKIFKIKG